MTSAFNHLAKRVLEAALSLCLVLCLVLSTFSIRTDAARSMMSGEYLKDTLSVSQKLQETIGIPNDDERRDDSESEASQLIRDYIARYRNRPEVNSSMSFTTMQTALNAMAGHYKTFPNRALPKELKDRLNKELSKAEEQAAIES